MRRLPGAAAALAVVALLVCGPALAAHAASGTTTTVPGPQPTLSLADQTSWVTPGGTFTAAVAVHGLSAAERQGWELKVAVYPAISTRTNLQLSLRDRVFGYPLWGPYELPVSDLGSGPGGSYPLCIATVAPAPPGCPASVFHIPNGAAGVYPVQVSIVDIASGRVTDRLTTHLLFVPNAASPKLSFSWVLPFASPGPILPDGSRRLNADDIAALTQELSALTARSGLNVTIAPDPSTLAALAAPGASPAETRLLAEYKHDTAGLATLALPFVASDPSDLVDADLPGELQAQIDAGHRTDAAVLGSAAPTVSPWAATGALDRPTLTALADNGVTRLIIQSDQLGAVTQNLTTTQPVDLALSDTGGSPVTAVLADSLLASDLGGDDAVLAGHQLIADLAQIYFEAPNTAQRGVLLFTPSPAADDRSLLDTVMRGLSSSPIVSTTPASGLFELPTAAGSRYLANPARGRSPLPASDIRDVRSRIQSFAASFATPPAGVGQVDALILASEGSGLSPGARRAYIDQANSALRHQMSLVQVPPARAITLTSSSTSIPFTIGSALAQPMRITIRFRSDGLTFPRGDKRQLLLVPPNVSVRLPVIAHSSGRANLRIMVYTADGGLLVGSSTIAVNSTAISGVGIGLSAGAVLFLVVWWGRTIVRTRRKRRSA